MMPKKLSILFTVLISFGAGYLFNALFAKKAEPTLIKKVTGIGGIFFKCKDPGKMRTWYSEHLGLNTNQYGTVFEWHQGHDSTRKGFTQWSPFKETTTYFGKADQQYMINYRVDNLELLVSELQKKHITLLDTLATYDYGKFIHIEDMEGNKVELWEPNDVVYEKMGRDMGSKTTK